MLIFWGDFSSAHYYFAKRAFFNRYFLFDVAKYFRWIWCNQRLVKQCTRSYGKQSSNYETRWGLHNSSQYFSTKFTKFQHEFQFGWLRYLTKVDTRLSEMMKKNRDIRTKLRKIVNVFFTKREVSSLLSLSIRSSNIAVVFIRIGFREESTRFLKSLAILNALDPDDPNAFCTNYLDRYANWLDELEITCHAVFVANYKPTNAYRNIEPDAIQIYVESITKIETTSDYSKQ